MIELHLDDDVIAAMVAGTMPATERNHATAHLDSCDACRELVAEAALASDGDAPGYRFGEEVARGAMGRIVAARDVELDREVVVKRLIEPTPALIKRFEREVAITAALQHPGIVPVYRAGRLPNGEPFYAMRRVRGRAFGVVIAEATTPRARLALIPQVLVAIDAVAYAHSKRVIHRDLKPQNIIAGEFGEVVVIDWGLAKRLGELDDAADGAVDVAPDLTQDGAVLGTPAYMAPEQATGHDADTRTDVYALGAVLYHALAGKPPHVGSTVTEVLASARAGNVALLTGVPRDLAAIVERALAVDPSRRYADAGALGTDVRDFLAGQLVSAHAYSGWQLFARWIGRHRAAVAATIAILIGLGAIGGISFTRVRTARDRAQAQQRASEALVAFMLDDLRPPLEGQGKLALLEGAGHQVDTYYAGLQARGDLDEAALIRWGSALVLLGDNAYDRGDLPGARLQFEAARDRWQRAVAIAPLDQTPKKKLATSYDRLGDIARDQGDKVAARAAFTQALEMRDALAVRDVVGRGMSLSKLGDLARTSGQLDDASRLYRESADAFRSVPEGEEYVAQALARIAVVEKSRGHLAQAQDANAEALVLAERRRAASPEDPKRMSTLGLAHYGLAGARADLGEHEAALREYERARDLLDTLAQQDPSNGVWQASAAMAWGEIGGQLVALDRAEDAVPAYAHEIDIRTALAKRDPSNVSWQEDLALALYHLALGQNRTKRLPEAIASAQHAIDVIAELERKVPGDTEYPDDHIVFLGLLADTELQAEHYDKALAATTAAIEIARRWQAKSTEPTWKRRLAGQYWDLARTADARGDHVAMRTALQHAHDLYTALPATTELSALDKDILARIDKALAKPR